MDMIEERNFLVNKKYNGGGLTEEEARKLSFIRRRIDEIELAEYKIEIDKIFMEIINKYAD